MVLEIKSISCIEGLQDVPEILGLENDNNWLNIVCYSLSTKTGTLVFAHKTKIVCLSNKWDSGSQQYKYSIAWSSIYDDDITSVLCLPITSDISEAIATGFLVGFKSGCVQLLTPLRKTILSQQWYPEPVKSILIQDEKKTVDEIYVVYTSCVCILQCKELMRSLKNIEKIDATNNSLLRSMSCRIWKYGDSYGKSDAVTNSAIVGSKQVGLFDHLLAASMEGGFHAKYRSSAPQQLVVLTVGIKPFVGFYYAKEIIIQPMFTDVARAVADKVKTVLPSWFPGAHLYQTVTESSPSITTESMSLRYGLYDDHRATCRIWLSPYNRLAAVSDCLGRVILIDCVRSIILRVWKGYRDAQCSFIKVNEKLSKNVKQIKRKHAVFLAIYSPRRSTIDIWNVERGKKLTTFPAGPNGKLIQQCSYPSTATTSNGSSSSKSSYHAPVTAFYLNPTDFSIKEFTIPFHFALDTSSTKKQKDLHIINQIKLVLKTVDCNSYSENCAEIAELCESIQTNEMRFKCIHSLIKNRHLSPEIFAIMLKTFLKSIDTGLKEHEISDNEDEEVNKRIDNYFSNLRLYKFLSKYERLMAFYEGMKKKQKVDDDAVEVNEISSEDDFIGILKVIHTYQVCLNEKRPTKVSIQSPAQTNIFIEFLSIFDCTSSDGIQLNEAKSNRFTSVAFDLFDGFVQHNKSLDSFYKLAIVSTLSNKDLLRLFFRYWMEKEIRYNDNDKLVHHLNIFSQIVQMICDLDRDIVEYKYNALSSWWQDIREMLLENPSVFKSLLAALLCQDMSILYRQTENNESNGENEPFEEVSQETAQWSLLIGKLDDIAALSSILSFKPPHEINGDRSSANPNEIPALDYTIPDISLVAILNGGKGIVSELVAKWIASTGISPSVFFANGQEITEEYVANTSIIYVDVLRKHFPFSLKSGILLCHLTWEYVKAWSCEPHRFDYLKIALEHLSTFKEADFAIKHGICCIIWNQIIRKFIQQAIKSINRAAHTSEDTRTQHGFTDDMIPEFIVYCSKFLNHLLESRNSNKITPKYEDLLQDGPLPLSAQAIQQEHVNNEIVELHLQLNQVILIIASLNVSLKNSMNSLFNDVSQQLIGCEINKQLSESIPRPDDTVNKNRRHFLHRTINASVDLIRMDFEQIYLNDYNMWIERVMALGKQWTLNLEELLKYQVVQLYTHGWDECAERKLNLLAQQSSMGKILLSITGTRLNLFVKDKPDVYSQVVAIGSRISAYLESLDESTVKLPQQRDEDDFTFIDKLQKLARRTYQCLNEQESSDLKLAAQLFDACAEIKGQMDSQD